MWHVLWDTDQLFAEGAGRERHRPDVDEARVTLVRRLNTRRRRRHVVSSSELLLNAGRRLTSRSDFRWRTQYQIQALEAITSGREEVVVIIATGAGKSLLFMIPCLLPAAAVTIVLLPIVSLRVDMIRRLREYRLSYTEWTVGQRPDCPLVLVSAEAAASSDFLEYMQELVAGDRLDRIVIDECYLMVEAAHYRRCVAQLPKIRAVRTQFVYLTATLPPTIEQEFRRRNFLKDPLVIRSSAHRPNIRYAVRTRPADVDRRDGDDELDWLTDVTREYMNAPHTFVLGQDKILVYVPYRSQATYIASEFECYSYTSESGSPEEKAEIIERWLANNRSVPLVATQALAEGFDYPYVRIVIHFGQIDSLLRFSQESGRAGRDGLRATSVVLLSSPWQPNATVVLPDDTDYVPDYLNPSLRCQRERFVP